eukprot:scaffold206280_cov28-Tisochrysis_lutea.AAC.2
MEDELIQRQRGRGSGTAPSTDPEGTTEVSRVTLEPSVKYLVSPWNRVFSSCPRAPVRVAGKYPIFRPGLSPIAMRVNAQRA